MKIKVNGIELAYEKSGTGSPVIFLHGNGEDHTIFRETIDQLASDYTVYALDSRAHGESSASEHLSYSLMAKDVVCFIRKLGIKNPVICGFSDGAITGILIAIHYPSLLAGLISCGANITPDGLKARYRIWYRLVYAFTGDKLIGMMLREPHIPGPELLRIQIPVFLTAGENDVIRLQHTKRIAAHMNRGTLKIIKGENHGSYVIHSVKLYRIILPFLQKLNF
ncbi:alpha/beta fold hydrolase [Diplocloster agilis]|uniref:Alpha/beta hydrolase n=1 Tax=Diplocloster agilis TaxID=2850323 RepID=A0A949K3K3_9FIRM|nr:MULTISPECIES: alpha/beta hydrolase [Lachnospiraceae]MBU9739496.1 alpha/beta hydrolase [Diplocloster agilis]MBU9745212.1 alpha/beta hydrolase [Diplocloster agilis]MCU6736328.1 alpha/beta hydrolase [Suonthocola fibrivorans]SCJ89228.1 Haloacetate dehalogenase H-1 [uncultured Clostridium sp.]